MKQREHGSRSVRRNPVEFSGRCSLFSPLVYFQEPIKILRKAIHSFSKTILLVSEDSISALLREHI